MVRTGDDDVGRGARALAGLAVGGRTGRTGGENVPRCALAISVALVGVWPEHRINVMQPTIDLLVEEAMATKL